MCLGEVFLLNRFSTSANFKNPSSCLLENDGSKSAIYLSPPLRSVIIAFVIEAHNGVSRNLSNIKISYYYFQKNSFLQIKTSSITTFLTTFFSLLYNIDVKHKITLYIYICTIKIWRINIENKITSMQNISYCPRTVVKHNDFEVLYQEGSNSGLIDHIFEI